MKKQAPKITPKKLPDFCTLTVPLAAKLAAVVVHAEEMLSPQGHAFDRMALKTVIEDPAVQAWIKSCGALAPQRR